MQGNYKEINFVVQKNKSQVVIELITRWKQVENPKDHGIQIKYPPKRVFYLYIYLPETFLSTPCNSGSGV